MVTCCKKKNVAYAYDYVHRPMWLTVLSEYNRYVSTAFQTARAMPTTGGLILFDSNNYPCTITPSSRPFSFAFLLWGKVCRLQSKDLTCRLVCNHIDSKRHSLPKFVDWHTRNLWHRVRSCRRVVGGGGGGGYNSSSCDQVMAMSILYPCLWLYVYVYVYGL